jgi:crotonobetainyl-CoA:carnitine CoA-transferase CaiB-like acyl-CoA transferase
MLPTQEGGKPPLRLSVPQAWLHAAADAAGGALVAHFARLASGHGQHVDISAQQSVAQATLSSLLAAPLGHENFSIRPQPRSALRPKLDLSGSGAQTRRSKWPVRDGLVELHLAMGPAAGRFTNNLFAWMAEEGTCDAAMAAWDWVTLPQRIEAGEVEEDDLERAREAVGRFLAGRDKRSLIEVAIRRKLLLAPVNTVQDLVESPHFAARGVLQRIEEAPGRHRVLPGPFALTGAPPPPPPRPAPKPGEHNAEVYGGLLGLDAATLTALTREGVI